LLERVVIRGSGPRGTPSRREEIAEQGHDVLPSPIGELALPSHVPLGLGLLQLGSVDNLG